MALEQRDRTAKVFQQQVAQVAADSVANKDALDYEILAVRRHRIGGHLPSARPQAIGKVVKREAVVGTLPEPPADRGQAPVSVMNDVERPQLADLGGEVLGG